MAEGLAFLLDGVPEAERMARCRELRALALVYCGLAHPATEALGAAISDPAATGRALVEIDAIPALRRRRLLASYGALVVRTRRPAKEDFISVSSGAPRVSPKL